MLFKIDKNKYKTTIKGIATNLKINNNRIDVKINNIIKMFFVLSFNSFIEIFNDKSWILEINKKDIIKLQMINTKIFSWKLTFKKGNDAITIAPAGVGNPIKCLIWLLSILNLANLIALHIV